MNNKELLDKYKSKLITTNASKRMIEKVGAGGLPVWQQYVAEIRLLNEIIKDLEDNSL